MSWIAAAGVYGSALYYYIFNVAEDEESMAAALGSTSCLLNISNYAVMAIELVRNLICVGVHACKKVKKINVCFYIARSPVRRTAQNALHFTPWQTCSFNSPSLGSIQIHINYYLKTIHSHLHRCLQPGTHLYS